jgi:hypothetical protein
MRLSDEVRKNSIDKKFYNLEQKKEYLDTRPNNKAINDIISLFKRIGAMMEKPLNKDISDMNQQEFLGMFVSLQIYDYTTIRKTLSLIRDYIDWAIAHGKSQSQINVARLVNAEDISIEKNLELACVKDDLDLKDKVYTVYEFGNGYTPPPLLFLMWIGIPIKDAILLKNEDVDTLNGIVHYGGKQLVIPESMIETFRDYKATDVGVRDGYRGSYQLFMGESDYFLKKIYKDVISLRRAANEPINYATITSVLSNFKNKYFDITGKRILLNNNSIVLSGELYRLYQQEQNGVELTDEILVGDKALEKSKSNIKVMAYDKRLQYEAYKKVFWS